MPLWSPIVVLVLVLALVVFGIYFFLFTNDSDWSIHNDEFPKSNALRSLLDSRLEENPNLTLSDALVNAYLDRKVIQAEQTFSWETLNKGKVECGNNCFSLMTSVKHYMDNFTMLDPASKVPNWLLVTYKLPENKPVPHLCRSSDSYFNLVQYNYKEVDKLTLEGYKPSSVILPLPGGESLKVLLIYK